MRVLISLRLTRITSFFAASATRSGVTPLILRASNTTTRHGCSKRSSWSGFGWTSRRARIRNTHFLRRAIAGTRTSPQPQQLAVSPNQLHRMIPRKVTSASELKASQAHIWADIKKYRYFLLNSKMVPWNWNPHVKMHVKMHKLV